MGLYKLVFVEHVRKKELPKIPAKDRGKILKVIDGLRLDPRPEKAFRLTNREEYRLRQGNYRILYTIEDEIRIVEIRQVGHGKSVYEKQGL